MIDPIELTPREEDVLKLLVVGCSNREAAELLSVSIRTIESHRFNLRSKICTTIGLDKKDVTLSRIIEWAKTRLKVRPFPAQVATNILFFGYQVADPDSVTVMIGV